MRTLKFRGKTTGNTGAWIFGYYHYDKSTNTHYICDAENLLPYEVSPGTVGQFIRTVDGLDVYENDLLIVIGIVGRGDGCFDNDIHLARFDEQSLQYRVGDYSFEEVEIRKVGNKFDDPELVGQTR